MNVPFQINFDGVRFEAKIDSDNYKIKPETIFYVSKNGASTHDGLSLETAASSLNQAIKLGNATKAPYEIRVSKGEYKHTHNWTISPTQDFNIIGKGQVVVSFDWNGVREFI